MKTWFENIREELNTFVPSKIYDMHAHLYRTGDLRLSEIPLSLPSVREVSIDFWKTQVKVNFHEAELIGGLFFPYPSPDCDVDSANNYLLSQLASDPMSRGLVLVKPDSDAHKISSYLDHPQVVGLKPYCFYAANKNDPAMDEFVPEWAWQMAHEKKLLITIHLVRPGALSDADNYESLRVHCLKYPLSTVILAHAARGFYAPNTAKAITKLAGLDNIYFDTSAICESLALFSVLKEFGPDRLLWGSDFPLSQLQGKCVTLGDGFAWLESSAMNFENLKTCRPMCVGLESLRALKEAGDYFGLNNLDYKKIFFENAISLLGIQTCRSNRGQELYQHAKSVIPTGTQLMSKRPERYAPDLWPAYFSCAKGCETWDIDGRHYYDMSGNGIGACLLGFRDPDVTAAVQRRINLGSMSTLNPPEEVELADLLCEIHPWAKQVRFTRSGGETAAVAVRIARASTRRSLIAVCGYHGWHDWYLAANLGETDALDGHLLPGLNPLGVPKELRGTTLAFKEHDRQEFESIIKRYGDKLAAVIMEPARHHDPEPGWLELVRDKTRQCGAMLIFDEITIGFRLNIGGVHLKLGIAPDIAILAKALGNGHPIGAVIGTKEAMAGAHQSFISSTYWTESVGPVAAIATLQKMRTLPDFNGHLARMGKMVQGFWRKYASEYNLPVEVEDGYPPLASFKFKHEFSAELMTLYTQLMLEKSFLAAGVIYTTMGHTTEIMELYGEAIRQVFERIAQIIYNNTIKQSLKGPVAYSGFARLTR